MACDGGGRGNRGRLHSDRSVWRGIARLPIKKRHVSVSGLAARDLPLVARRNSGLARPGRLAETPADRIILAKVEPGETLRSYASGGWKQSGDFASNDDWTAYLAAWAKRQQSPIKIAKIEAQ
jgi:hypothetical protein